MKQSHLWKTAALFTAVLIGLCGYPLLTQASRSSAPLTHPALPGGPAELVMTEKERLGKSLFFDTALSNPGGQACGSCHNPIAGFTYPQSDDNAVFGPVAGAVSSRFGYRKPPSVAYATYFPAGPPHFDNAAQAYVGGLFWDGRAPGLLSQVHVPLESPDEMNNFHNGAGDPGRVVAQIAQGPYADEFQALYGQGIFQNPTAAFADIADAISAYEKSRQLSPFSSKYDAWRKGQATLSSDEMDGLRLMTGSWSGRPNGLAYYKIIGGRKVFKNALCSQCHSIPPNPQTGPDLWTNSSYANIGVPPNPGNPYYTETDSLSNPYGYNPMGAAFVDIGLGDYLYPQMGLPAGNTGLGSNGEGDFLQINGTFQVPTLRNVGKVPFAGFVKAYMHNGVFKSLKQVVHFYNTRNLTTRPGEVIDFTQSEPYAHLAGTALWPQPEYSSPMTLQNAAGLPVTNGGRVGNLGLTDEEENHIVAFLETLSDGYSAF